MKTFLCILAILAISAIEPINGCLSAASNRRMDTFFGSFSPKFSLSRLFGNVNKKKADNDVDTIEVTRLNAPGQRFTATHGIEANKGQQKLFLFVVDRPDANYIAVSSNIAIQETRGGPDRYELYMKLGRPPTPIDYDVKSTLTSSDSYVGDVLYSRDITVTRPAVGEYYFLLVAHKDLQELLITAIMDTPPDEKEAGFTIRRMGVAAVN